MVLCLELNQKCIQSVSVHLLCLQTLGGELHVSKSVSHLTAQNTKMIHDQLSVWMDKECCAPCRLTEVLEWKRKPKPKPMIQLELPVSAPRQRCQVSSGFTFDCQFPSQKLIKARSWSFNFASGGHNVLMC